MYSVSHHLPKELCNIIDDMACRKRVNGDKKSNELILIFELHQKASDIHDELMKWLFKCLDTISDKVYDGHQYNWNIISQIQNNDYQDETDNKLLNTIVVAIHIDDDSHIIGHNDGLIPYNGFSPSMTLLPQDIMDCLIQEPAFINKIAINAVSSDVMMQWCEEMISTEPNVFDIAGEGFMKHPMWIKDTSAGWVTIRERSYNFGWKGYDP